MKTLIIAPHADDETLGLGGTLLKRSSKKGNKLYWLLITEPQSPDYSQKFPSIIRKLDIFRAE